MPTGYTAGVQDGTVTDFQEYALECARNFGAIIMMRDDPRRADIPVFEPSDCNAKAIVKATDELAELMAMTPEQRQSRIDQEHTEAVRQRTDALARIELERGRYESMLEKAKAFHSPSTDHDGYAEFIVQQLEESIKWDCDNDYFKTPIVKPSDVEWMTDRMAKLRKDIAHYEREQAKEVERTNGRNEWVRLLREALKN
jgi:hypothetical protein